MAEPADPNFSLTVDWSAPRTRHSDSPRAYDRSSADTTRLTRERHAPERGQGRMEELRSGMARAQADERGIRSPMPSWRLRAGSRRPRLPGQLVLGPVLTALEAAADVLRTPTELGAGKACTAFANAQMRLGHSVSRCGCLGAPGRGRASRRGVPGTADDQVTVKLAERAGRSDRSGHLSWWRNEPRPRWGRFWRNGADVVGTVRAGP